jgi:steroid 5-alpha reductase family enzyme
MRVSSLVLFAASTDAFTPALRKPVIVTPTRLQVQAGVSSYQPRATVAQLRGGTTSIHASVAAAIAGPFAVPTAAGIAAVAGTLAYIHQAYIFSLSYGLTMAGIGAAVLMAAPTSTLLTVHAGLVTAYGIRLFAFLLWRQKFQPGYDGAERLKALDKTPPLQRTPVIISTAVFYALMASPLLYHVKAVPFAGLAALVSTLGSALAFAGLAIEAIADQQKSLFKMALRRDGKGDELYTGGVYAKSRHANYLGEMAFWLGSFIAGLPAIFVGVGVPLSVRLVRALNASLGLAGIMFIMLSATKRLEGKQAVKYGTSGKEGYERYCQSSGSLLPKFG